MTGRAARAAGFVVRCAALFLGLQAGWPALGGAELAAQQGCSFIEGSGNLSTIDMGGGQVTYVSTPNLACRDGVRIRADSAVAYQAAAYYELIGSVRFEDAGQRLTASRAEYFTTVGRLQAHGAVQVEQKDDGSVITGDEMIYLRAGDDRARDQLDVFGGVSGARSHARLFVRRTPPAPDSAGTSPTDTDPVSDSSAVPYDVAADRIVMDGDSQFRAMGDVEIERETMQAFGDSVEYDQVGGTLRIAERARMIMDGRELTAAVIQARLPGEVVSEVIARERAVLTAEDVRLEAPLIHAFFDAGVMERLVAIPIPPLAPGALGSLPPPPTVPPDASDPVQPAEDETARPVARARSFEIEADSIDVLTPAEVLERIHAAGTARAESSARDSLNTPQTPALARTDWMEGDTIVATFSRVESGAGEVEGADSTEYRLERLTATRSARSLYRIAGDSARACGPEPLIHYVVADRIVIEMENGEIDSMHVTGQTQGVHAEPSACVPADSAAADSIAADSATAPLAARDRPLPASRPALARGNPAPDGVARPEPTLRARERRFRRRR